MSWTQAQLQILSQSVAPPVFHSFDKQNFVVLFRIVLVSLVLWVFNINDRIRLSASKKKSAGTFLGIAICKECTSYQYYTFQAINTVSLHFF